MKITVQYEVANMDSDTLTAAMDATANAISDRGYNDCEPERCKTEDGTPFIYTVFCEPHAR